MKKVIMYRINNIVPGYPEHENYIYNSHRRSFAYSEDGAIFGVTRYRALVLNTIFKESRIVYRQEVLYKVVLYNPVKVNESTYVDPRTGFIKYSFPFYDYDKLEVIKSEILTDSYIDRVFWNNPPAYTDYWWEKYDPKKPDHVFAYEKGQVYLI